MNESKRPMAPSSATLFSISPKRFSSVSGMVQSYFNGRSRSTAECQPRSPGGSADHSLVDRSELAQIDRTVRISPEVERFRGRFRQSNGEKIASEPQQN